MKFYLLILGFIIIPISTFSQVGIGTDAPTNMLDVNGDMRIRKVLPGSTRAAKDSILVVNGEGVVQIVPSNKVLNSDLVSFVKGKSSTNTISVLNLDLFSGWKKIKFDAEDLDANNDYDAVTDYSFTAPKPGAYHIYVHYAITSLVSLSNSIGVGIIKKSGGTTSLLAEDTSSLVNVLTINVSSPVRQVQTIANLEKGDKIYFALHSSLVDINLLSGDGTPTRTFFTIHQIQ